jgi:hypothetical protein
MSPDTVEGSDAAVAGVSDFDPPLDDEHAVPTTAIEAARATADRTLLRMSLSCSRPHTGP